MSFAQFNGFSHIGYAKITDQLDSNMVSFVDYGLLALGGFFNVTLDLPYPYGSSHSKLRLCDDPRYIKGMVWESARSNWVWETGIEYYKQPISISGIYVNNAFIPNNSGYYIDYPRGRVVFDSPKPLTSIIKMEYSYRYYNIYSASLQWFRQLQNDSFRVDDSQFNQYGSGAWSLLSDSRAQMPAIFPYIVDKRSWIPKQLGGGTYCQQDILFYCFGENSTDRDGILDILSSQQEKRIFFYDKNLVAASSAYPLNINGKLVNTTYRNFVDLVNNFLWADAVITKATVEDKNDQDAPNLYRGSVRWTLKIDFPQF